MSKHKYCTMGKFRCPQISSRHDVQRRPASACCCCHERKSTQTQTQTQRNETQHTQSKHRPGPTAPYVEASSCRFICTANRDGRSKHVFFGSAKTSSGGAASKQQDQHETRRRRLGLMLARRLLQRGQPSSTRGCRQSIPETVWPSGHPTLNLAVSR